MSEMDRAWLGGRDRRESLAWVRVKVSHQRGGDTGVRQRPKTEKREVKLRVRRRKENDQNSVVLWLVEPGQNRFNRSGSRFLWLNRRFPVFGLFFINSGFFRKLDRIEDRSPVEPVEPTGPVQFLKPWVKCHFLTNVRGRNVIFWQKWRGRVSFSKIIWGLYFTKSQEMLL